MKRALTAPWMRECNTCLDLVDALNQTELDAHMALVRSWEEVRVHLVEEHVALLPEYAESCANCQEWKVMVGAMDSPASEILAREVLLHRAGHLLYDEKV